MICSGDSFALGFGVDDRETWCHQLGVFDPRLDTVNMGQGGYGVGQAWLWWQRDGASLEHHGHLFTFITEDFARLGSDHFFGYGKPRLRLRGGELVVDNVPVPRRAFRWPWLTHNAHLLDGLRSVALGRRLLASGRDPEARPPAVTLSRRLALAVFGALAREQGGAGRERVFVWLPMRPDHQPRRADAWREGLVEEARRRGLTVVDLVPALTALPQEEVAPLFIAEGALDFPGAAGHYTALGNRRVAEWIYARVGGRSSAPRERRLPRIAESRRGG